MAQMIGSWIVGSREMLFVISIFRRRVRSWKCCEWERKEENENWIGNQIDGKEEICAGNVWCVVCCVRCAATVTMQFPCVPLVSTVEEVEVHSVTAQPAERTDQ